MTAETATPIQDAEREAAAIRAQAEADATAIVSEARERADAFAQARIERVRELTDRLVATAENVERRFGDALGIKDQLDDLIGALGDAAQRAAHDHQTTSRGLEPLPDSRPSAVRVLDVGLS